MNKLRASEREREREGASEKDRKSHIHLQTAARAETKSLYRHSARVYVYLCVVPYECEHEQAGLQPEYVVRIVRVFCVHASRSLAHSQVAR